MAKTRKLTISLLKTEVSDPQSVVPADQPVKKFRLGDNGELGTLYLKRAEPKDAIWIDFFAQHISPTEFNQVCSAGGLLVREHLGRIFAITFGNSGQFLLPKDLCEERFGLRIALNSIDKQAVKSIDRNRIDTIARQSREQTSQKAEFRDFFIDTDRDLLGAVTGNPEDESFGDWITGKDSVTIKTEVSLETLPTLLEQLFDKYKDNSYQTKFPWVDNLAPIRDATLPHELDAILIERMNEPNGTNNVWMAVPEIMNWNNLAGFRFRGRHSKELSHDIHLNDFRKSLKPNEPITIDLLKSRRIDWADGNNIMQKGWSAYECLYAEVEHCGSTFLLSDRKWYRAQPDFVQRVDESFSSIPDYSFQFPPYDKDSEAAYLIELGERFPEKYSVFDRQNLQHGGDRSKIEYCDLLSTQKDLIHVKHYHQSAPLSHLFAQGLVSGELFQLDAEFRRKLNEKLPDGRKLANTLVRPSDKEYAVVFAIISDRPGPLKLPLFSRLTLKHATERLKLCGFRVFKAKIPVSETYALRKKLIARSQRA